jgi:hypothetical protein
LPQPSPLSSSAELRALRAQRSFAEFLRLIELFERKIDDLREAPGFLDYTVESATDSNAKLITDTRALVHKPEAQEAGRGRLSLLAHFRV